MTFRALCLPLGTALLSSAVTWIAVDSLRSRPAPLHSTAEELDYPELRLLPPGTTVEKMYSASSAQKILESPQKIVLHPRVVGISSGLSVAGYDFEEKGVELPTDFRDSFLYTLHSVTTYRSSSACAFNPDILVRLERDGKVLDLLFSFSCSDLRAYVQGETKLEEAMGNGISYEGRRAFLTYMVRAIPDNALIAEFYSVYE